MKELNSFISALLFCVGLSTATGQVTLYPADTYVDQGSPSSNYSGTLAMSAGRYSSGSYYSQRALLQFNLSGIPSGAIVTSAQLKVYRTASAANPSLYVARNTGTWTPSSVTWNSKPSYSISDLISTSSTTIGWLTVDVTNHVQGMVDGDYSNLGWTILHQNEGLSATQYMTVRSSEYSGIGYDPQLVVSYYIPLSITSATIVHESSSGASDGSISPIFAGGPGGTYTYQWYNSSGSMTGQNGSTLSNVPYGWYGLQVANAGMDTFYYAFLVGLNCQQVAIEFNPGPNYIADAMIYDLIRLGVNYGNNNYGNYTLITADSWTYTNWYDMKTLLKFNLWVDESIIFSQADLRMISATHNPLSRPNESELVKIIDPWMEFDVTFNTAPALSTNTSDKILLPATVSNTENLSVDIRDFWDDWKLDNSLNFGMMFQLQSYANSYTKRTYHSSDAASASNRPKINFEVTVYNSECLAYNELKRSLDGGYAIALDGVIKFTMDEEYKMDVLKYLPIKIFDQNHDLLESSDLDGTVLNASISPLDLEFDDNRWELDISGIPGVSVGSYYTIEVLTSKGEKRYLRFLYKN